MANVDVDSLTLQITSDTSGAIDGLKTLIGTLGELKKVTSGGCGLGRVSKELQSVRSQSEKTASSNRKSSKSFAEMAAKIATVTRVLKKVGNTLASWIGESTEYVESMNLFNVSMGQYAIEAKEYAESVSDLMGIDPAEWMRNQGVFMTLATGFGVAGDRANTMSQQLTQLGYDISSFSNISVGDAMQRLQSGIAGELEPLRRLGYDLSQAKLEATALSLGIDKAVSSMTQAEKAELRYYAIMTQVTHVQGDMARTLQDPANQLRILKAQVTQAARALGNIFIPALNAVIPYAVAALKVIRRLADTISSLFGYTLPEVGDYTLNDFAVSSEDAADGLGDAAKNAGKLKKMLLGIDELNVMSDTSGSGSDTSIGGSFDFELPTYDFLGAALDARVDEIQAQLEQTLGEITTMVSGFALAVGAILLLTGASIPIGLGLMAAGAAGMGLAIVANWGSMGEQLANTLSLITGVVTGFAVSLGAILLFSGVNIPLGIGLLAVGLASTVASVAVNWHSSESHVADAITSVQGIVSGACLALGALLAFSGVAIPMGIALMATGALSIAASQSINWSSLLSPVESTAGRITQIVATAMLALGTLLAFTGVATPLGIALMAAGAASLITSGSLSWNGLSDSVKDTIATITTIVSAGLLAVGAILAFSGVGIPLGIALMAGGALMLGSTASVRWDSVKNTIKSVVAAIGAIVGGSLIVLGVLLMLSGVGVGLGLAVLAAGLGLSYGAWKLDDNPVTQFVKKMANSVIGIINRVISAINEMFHISFKGLTMLGQTVIPAFDVRLVNLSKIPTFADGGMVNTGQMFIAREAGPEMVGSIGNRTAVANNDQIVESVSQGVYRAVVQAMGQSGGDTVVEAKVNDRVLFEVVVNRARQETMRKGYNPLLGGV